MTQGIAFWAIMALFIVIAVWASYVMYLCVFVCGPARVKIRRLRAEMDAEYRRSAAILHADFIQYRKVGMMALEAIRKETAT